MKRSSARAGRLRNTLTSSQELWNLPPHMSSTPGVYLGTDSGATTSKTGGVWADGSTISTRLRQSSTNAQAGTTAVVQGWIDGVEGFLT
ncbi:MAG TPA: hypothetical protein VHF69_10460, partial [Candidatus Synoicihabitans sp.]|nr:hypothetical protein [Candidatus Synoicihabitans sp.]